jgi:hypothetical protein
MDVVLVGSHAPVCQAALMFLDIGLYAELFPLLADHFTDLRELEEPHKSLHFDAQPAFAVRAQAIALGILLVQAKAVEHGLGLLRIVDHSRRYSGPGL